MAARAKYRLAVPGNAEAVVTITMTIEEWRRFVEHVAARKEGSGYSYEVNGVIRTVEEAVRQAEKVFTAESKEESV